MQFNRITVSGLIVMLASVSPVAWSGPIVIAPITEYLNTASSDINGTTFYGVDFIPTTNVDHTIAILAGGTLNAVGDSITLPIQLTSMELSPLPYGSLYGSDIYTTTGSEPVGSITIDYSRNNEGGTFTGTLPVNLVYEASGATLTDTLSLQGDWSIVGVSSYPFLVSGPAFYIGDLNGKKEPIIEDGSQIHDVAYIAGPEPATFGAELLGIVALATLVFVRRKQASGA